MQRYKKLLYYGSLLDPITFQMNFQIKKKWKTFIAQSINKIDK